MNGIWKMALIATALLLVGSAAAKPPTTVSAPEHANDHALEASSVHSVLHRSGLASSDADRQCDAYDNHGAYVSSVAQASDGDETDDAEERGNKTRDHNGTRGRENREHANQTHEREDDADADEAHADNPVSVAARSDIGKCGGADKEREPAPADGNVEGEDDSEEEVDQASHGRSDEARSEHPPRNQESE